MTFLFLLSTWRLGPFYFHSIVNVSTLFVITPILPCSNQRKQRKAQTCFHHKGGHGYVLGELSLVYLLFSAGLGGVTGDGIGGDCNVFYLLTRGLFFVTWAHDTLFPSFPSFPCLALPCFGQVLLTFLYLPLVHHLILLTSLLGKKNKVQTLPLPATPSFNITILVRQWQV